MMDMNARVKEALKDSDNWFPNVARSMPHHLIGAIGEFGELCNLYKKWERKRTLNSGMGYKFDEETQMRMEDEVIDTFVYLFNVAGILNMNLEAAYDRKREFNEVRFGRDPKVG